MPKFNIPIAFTVLSTVTVEADDYEAACEVAYEAPLPSWTEWACLEDSILVREDDYEVMDDETGMWDNREVEQFGYQANGK